MEWILTGDLIGAEDALRYGIVSRVVPAQNLLTETEALAQKIASKPPLAVQLAKESIQQSFELPLEAGLALERKNFYLLFASDDQKEGMAAFIEKRKAVWTGK